MAIGTKGHMPSPPPPLCFKNIYLVTHKGPHTNIHSPSHSYTPATADFDNVTIKL